MKGVDELNYKSKLITCDGLFIEMISKVVILK